MVSWRGWIGAADAECGGEMEGGGGPRPPPPPLLSLRRAAAATSDEGEVLGPCIVIIEARDGGAQVRRSSPKPVPHGCGA